MIVNGCAVLRMSQRASVPSSPPAATKCCCVGCPAKLHTATCTKKCVKKQCKLSRPTCCEGMYFVPTVNGLKVSFCTVSVESHSSCAAAHHEGVTGHILQ
ncbi:hypothetical protein E2C01_040447 [Portunus trituberculatus]|uniref:Uncharacterized protein n=1 Tax=Portunus trituberculatus TaxID=210409 RepID=A0A5B7FHH7_PORTR|nr:hypothetical protein [Portunus trituberculatus]